MRVAESNGSESAAVLRASAAYAGRRPARPRAQGAENRPVALRRQQAIRQLAPVFGRGHTSAGWRFYDRRDNSASISLLGLGVVLVGALIALWWTTGVQVDLSVLRGPAAFLDYSDVHRPAGRPGADPADPGTTMAAVVQAPLSRQLPPAAWPRPRRSSRLLPAQ